MRPRSLLVLLAAVLSLGMIAAACGDDDGDSDDAGGDSTSIAGPEIRVRGQDFSENITLAEVKRCANEGIHLSSFALIEDYFYLGLVNFVEQMAAVSGGIAAYCNAEDLGNMVLDSFTNGRRKRRMIG